MIKPVASTKLDALTGLRYIAALTILLSHTSHIFSHDQFPRYTSIMGNLWLIGMPLFFVLSGFLMTFNYTEQFQKSWFLTTWRFYAARIARIYPVYLIALFLSLGFMGAFFHELRDRPYEVYRGMGRVLTLTQSWNNYMLFEGHIQPRPIAYAYLGVGWSVSVEAFFYLLFPFMVLLLPGKMNRIWKVAGCAVGVFALFTYFNYLCVKLLDPSMHIMARGSLRGWLIYTSPFMRLGEFIIGCLAGQLYRLVASSTPGRWERLFGHVFLWGSIFCLGRFTIHPPSWETPTLKNHLQFNTGYAPFCAAIIFCLARYPSLLGRFLALPPLVLFGEASYGMYLIHPLFQSIFYPRATGEVDIKTETIMWFDNIGMVVCLHFFCLGMYQFAESPLRRILRKWLSPSEPARKSRPTIAPVPVTQPLAA